MLLVVLKCLGLATLVVGLGLLAGLWAQWAEERESARALKEGETVPDAADAEVRVPCGTTRGLRTTF